MKTVTNTYNSTTIPKKWMTTLTGISYLLMGILFYIRPFEGIHQMLIAFGVMLTPSSLFDVYFSTDNKDKIYSWGFNMINAISDLLMGLVFIIHVHLGNSFVLYSASFWILMKGTFGLNFSTQIKGNYLIKLVYLFSSLFGISISMLLITTDLFPVFPIREVFVAGLFSCTINKFISVYLLNKSHY